MAISPWLERACSDVGTQTQVWVSTSELKAPLAVFQRPAAGLFRGCVAPSARIGPTSRRVETAETRLAETRRPRPDDFAHRGTPLE